jgi:thiamine-monophosphate kinase
VTACAASSRPTISIGRGSSTGIAERSLIDAIGAALRSPRESSRLILGSGDDASIVQALPFAVSSIDTIVEGVHFRLQDGWATPAEVGHRALAGALSDLAAMGAAPGEAYLSLGLPPGFSEQAALELARSADELALQCGAAIAGGDVVSAPALLVSVAVTGWAERREQLVRRAGAQVGDVVGVTGELGASRAALAVMEGRAPRSAATATAVARARAPQPRLRAGRALAEAGVHAMIDVSDGLAADAAHLARASGVTLRVRLEALPLAPGVAEVARALEQSPAELAAAGGEDYELCFCVGADRRTTVEQALGELRVSWIGEVSGSGGEPPLLVFSDDRGDAIGIEGFEHRW